MRREKGKGKREKERAFFLASCEILCVLFLLMSLAAHGAQTQAHGPQRVTLTDGVRLILNPEPDADVVALCVFVRRVEPDRTPQEEAIGEVVAHALFFGSLNRSYDAVMDSIGQVGGGLEIRQTPDTIAITCVTVPRQVREAIYLLCESLKNADFEPEALERARKDLLKERQQHPQDLFSAAYDALSARVRGVPEAPDPFLYQHVTQQQAQAYFQAHYLPARTVIAVGGRFNAPLVQSDFDNLLFDYDRQPPRPLAPADPPQPSLGGSPQQYSTPGGAAYALVATSTPAVTDPDYPAFLVLHAALGSGHASRLFRRVRDTLGIGYEVGASFRANLGEPLIAYLQWDPGRAASAPAPPAALKLLTAQMDTLISDPLTDAELVRARNMAIGRDALRHERARDRAFLLGWYEVMGAGYAFDADLPHRLASVTRDDVLRVAKTYLSQRASALVIPAAK
ncbi:MAG TPA: pitrilysin family protein [Chthonomonadaceae bacterium]|nr:pitrilysin family protein [Chthonomonadaceae bacterium]